MTVFESLLISTFTVERRDRVSDGSGGWAIAYSETDPIVGRIRPASSAEREAADREERQITHVLYVRHGEDIARGDRVTCGDLTVEVMGVREPSLMGHHLEIDCLERQYEAVEEAGS